MKKHLLLVLAFVVLAQGARCADFTEVVAFGDSFTDYGNNGIATDTSTSKPSSKIAGTCAAQIATHFGLPLKASKNGGTNYAKGGAVTGGIFSQVTTYLDAHPAASPTALYFFFGGGNDINYYLVRKPFDQAGLLAAATKAADNIKAQIAQVAAAGGRHFIWFNMYPLNETPLVKRLGVGPVLVPAVERFNTAWAENVKALRAQFPEIALIDLDMYAKSYDILNNPEKYELESVSEMSKGKAVDPDRYFFWDELHPTTRGHQIFAQFAVSLLDRAMTPSTTPVEAVSN